MSFYNVYQLFKNFFTFYDLDVYRLIVFTSILSTEREKVHKPR